MHNQIIFSSTDRLHRFAIAIFYACAGVSIAHCNRINWNGVRLRLRGFTPSVEFSIGPAARRKRRGIAALA